MGYSVMTWVAGLISPILPTPSSVNQRLPSGPAVIPMPVVVGNTVLAWVAGLIITEFTLPNSNANPEWITVGPDGNLWFTVPYVNGQPADTIGMISPTTHAITQFSTPTANSAPAAITVGPDGNLWFNEF